MTERRVGGVEKKWVCSVVVSHLWSCHSMLWRHRVCFLLTRYVYSISIGLPPSVCLSIYSPCHSSGLMRPYACYLLTDREVASLGRVIVTAPPPVLLGSSGWGRPSFCYGANTVPGGRMLRLTINQTPGNSGSTEVRWQIRPLPLI